MRAAVLSEVHAPLVIEDIPAPRPHAGEVLIRVAACGVCHTDLHVIKGEVKFPTPAVLGHEISGTVAAVGTDTAPGGGPRLTEGMPVVCSFIMPCGTCAWCAQGRDDLCETFFAMNRLRGTLYDGKGNGVAGAEIRVIDANGNATSAYTGPEGNFHASGALAMPGHAGARNTASTALMVSSLTYAGCNKCHCSATGCMTMPMHLP